MKFLFAILFPLLPGSLLFSQDLQFNWARQVGGSQAEQGFSIITDLTGNSYITGYFTGTADFDPGPGVFNLNSTGSQSIYVSKFNPSGLLVWAKKMGSSGPPGGAVGMSIKIDLQGNIYITGNFAGAVDFDPGPGVTSLQTSAMNGYREIYVMKLDGNGNLIWVKQFGGTNTFGLYSASISVDGQGNVLTTGFFSGNPDFDPGPGVAFLNSTNPSVQSMFVSKLNASGNFVWVKQVGESNGNCWGFSITNDAAGNVFVTGGFGGTVGSPGVVDFDPGPGFSYLSCSPSSTAVYVLRLDGSGNFSWVTQLNYGINNMARSICLDGTGNIFIAGYGTNNNSDVFISKLASSGALGWTKKIGGTGYEEAHALTVDVSGNIYVTGFFEGVVDFDPGPAVAELTSSARADIFIMKADGSGNLLWAKKAGGTDTDAGYAVSVNSQGDVFAIGSFTSTSDFDPGIDVYNLGAFGETDVFVLKLSKCAAVVHTFTQYICAGQNYMGYTTSGTYQDTLTGVNGCDSIRILNLSVLPQTAPDLGADRNICAGDSLVLSPGVFNSYSWQDGSNASHLVVNKPGVYSVLVQDQCGTGIDEVVITEKDCAVYFPSAFSPNNDGRNEQFKVLTQFQLPGYHLSVFNRWGQLVFETKDPSKGWDGRVKGELPDAGLFIWHCEFRMPSGSTVTRLKGAVLLIR